MPSQIGLVVHPSRAVDAPLAELRGWAGGLGVTVVQVPAPCQQQRVAQPGAAEDCDLIVSIGGDGTTLAALRAGAVAGRPVLGVACGSLGALTAVAAGQVGRALERFTAGDCQLRSLPALDVAAGPEEPLFAINDVALVREGGGQLRLVLLLDGTLFARLAGDGCVVSTPMGSSAYALAAGGPLLAPEVEAFLFTPLPTHGGSCPSLVAGAGSTLELEVTAGYGGARLEVDGQVASNQVGGLRISCRSGAATIVRFSDQEPFLSGLRRRGILADSPRILAEENPEGSDQL